MKDRIIVDSQAAAAVFASERQRKIIQALMATRLTLVALSGVVALPLSLVHYHVSKLMRLGLIEVVEEQRRAGRAQKVYCAAAKEFVVPAELIVELPGTGLAQQMREALNRHLARSLVGVSFTHDGQRPRANLLKDPAQTGAALELWLDMGLRASDAAELALEMQALADRFRARGDNLQPRYLVQLVAVRV